MMGIFVSLCRSEMRGLIVKDGTFFFKSVGRKKVILGGRME